MSGNPTYQELTEHLCNCFLLRLIAPKTSSPMVRAL
jgi:hypothetical protein